MGVLADLLVAEMADAQSIVTSDYPLETYKGSNADGLDPLMLAELHALLTGQPPRELLAAYRPAAQASEQGPWLIHVPAEMVRRLADVAPQDHPALAVQWAASERMRERAADEQWAEQMLERAAFLAQSAAFEGKELFLVIYD
jgi:hypothetical protein